MIQIKTKKSLPAIAVFKGEVPGCEFVCHTRPHDGVQGWSYCKVTTSEQLAEVKKNPALAGFKNTINGYPSRYENVKIHYEIDDVIAGDQTPYQVLLIEPSIPVVRHHLQLGDIVTVISSKAMPPDAMVYPIPPGRVSVKYDFPVITPGSFDIVKVDTTEVDTFDGAGLRDYAEEALRPGGIMQLTASDHQIGFMWSRFFATRFERLAVDTHEYSEDCRQPDPENVTVYGVKKAVKKHDPAEQAYLEVCLEHKINNADRIPGAIYRYAATPWNPGHYPPARTVTVKKVKRYDDSKYLSLAEGEEMLALKVLPSKEANVFTSDFLYVKADELKQFGKSVKLAWGSKNGGYDLEMDNPAEQLPALRKFLAEEKQDQWEVHIKGQKAITSTFLEEVVHPEFSPAAGLKPTLLPKYIDLDFAETWFCNAEPLPEEEVVEDAKQLVFPVAPSLANLMKLFGQLRPAVVQGKDGVYYLASGTVNTEVLTTEIVDDKGREVTVENTKKRAKLVTFALTGTDAGQQYEAEMS